MALDLTIQALRAREILDSRGTPTIEVEAVLAGGAVGRAAVPSGASTGSREAVELRDGDVRRYRGKGVRRAIAMVTERIAPALRGLSADDQGRIDRLLRDLDGSPEKMRLGANAILGVSLAVAKAVAAARGVPLHRAFGHDEAAVLPVPMLNVLNGGRHAAGGLDFQELMIVPVGLDSFAEAMRAAVETYWALADILAERGLRTGVGDEGGFAPPLPSVEQGLACIVDAIERAGYRPGEQVALALDPAASEFHRDDAYVLARAGGTRLSSAEMVEWYRRLIRGYPIVGIEDGLGESDWKGWRGLTEAIGKEVLLVGDDLFVTNPELIREGVAREIANAVLIKLNQIGTVSETLEAIEVARRGGYRIVVSHRSGETEDTTIADFAVAVGAEFIKTGAPCRGERTAKYNQLLRIEEALGAAARYRGREALLRRG
ncbi:MAG: phosphopyruvate hydratase [Candidatus Rokubacteria bacterium]|nr:phosphopyruvate hydratase [Candidatus Rokubacteria bacterium]